MNSVNIIGNLTRDPELKTTAGAGKNVVRLGLAVNEGSGDRKTTSFFDVVVWEKQADYCAAYLHKGSRVAIEGRLSQRTWEKDGVKRSVVEIIANRVHGLDKRTDQPSGQTEHGAAKANGYQQPEQNTLDDDGSVPF